MPHIYVELILFVNPKKYKIFKMNKKRADNHKNYKKMENKAFLLMKILLKSMKSRNTEISLNKHLHLLKPPQSVAQKFRRWGRRKEYENLANTKTNRRKRQNQLRNED